MHLATTKRSFSDKFWHDNQGHLAIVQRPNLLLWLWILCSIINFFVSAGAVAHISGFVGKVAITLWALLELFWGDSYFRRLLGLVLILLSLVVLLH
jgi:hypothetical protein